MLFAESEWSALVVHGSTPGVPAWAVDARIQVEKSGIGRFHYVLRGDLSRLRIPPARSAARADGLWMHTCFEAFIREPGPAGYYELNFSPSGEWAVYRFNAYRQGISSPAIASPEISMRSFAERLEFDAAVRLHDLPDLRTTPCLRIGLNAVIEDDGGTLSYWALKHGPGKADFHCPDGFVLELAMQAPLK